MMLSTNILFKYIGVTIILACLTACASIGKPAAKSAVATIQAQSIINPNALGQPAPLVVIFYQLKDINNFNNAEFFSLYQNPQQTLGSDYITSRQAIILPGETKKLTLALQPDTCFIGIVAAFQQLNSAVWQAIIPVNRKTLHPTFKLAITKTSIQPITGAK